MALDTSAYRYVLISVLSVAVCGCGFFNSGVKVEEKDFVSRAEKEVIQIKANYVLLTGVFDIANQKMDELMYVPDGMKLIRVKWKRFHADVMSCWNTPFEAAENAQQRAVSAASAARHFRDQTARRELQVVRDTAVNAVNKLKECPQALADDVQGVVRRTPEEVKAWARDRMAIVNDLRVLVRKDVPSRATAFAESAASAPAKIQAIIKEADLHTETMTRLGTTEQQNKHKAQIAKLKQLEREIGKLRVEVTDDTAKIPDEVAELARQIEQSLTKLGRR